MLVFTYLWWIYGLDIKKFTDDKSETTNTDINNSFVGENMEFMGDCARPSLHNTLLN